MTDDQDLMAWLCEAVPAGPPSADEMLYAARVLEDEGVHRSAQFLRAFAALEKRLKRQET